MWPIDRSPWFINSSFLFWWFFYKLSCFNGCHWNSHDYKGALFFIITLMELSYLHWLSHWMGIWNEKQEIEIQKRMGREATRSRHPVVDGKKVIRQQMERVKKKTRRRTFTGIKRLDREWRQFLIMIRYQNKYVVHVRHGAECARRNCYFNTPSGGPFFCYCCCMAYVFCSETRHRQVVLCPLITPSIQVVVCT